MLTPPNSLRITGFAAVLAASSLVPTSIRRPLGAMPSRLLRVASTVE